MRRHHFPDDYQIADAVYRHETTSSASTWIIYYLTLYPIFKYVCELGYRLPANFSGLDIAAILESLPLLNGICNGIHRNLPSDATTMLQSKHKTNLIGRPIAAGTVLTIAPCVINKHLISGALTRTSSGPKGG